MTPYINSYVNSICYSDLSISLCIAMNYNALQWSVMCCKFQQIQVSRVDPIYCDILGPAERVRYMTSRLIGDISKKGVQH